MSEKTYTATELWAVIDDVLDSVLLAENEMLLALEDGREAPEIFATVRDYAVNRYGDD